MEKSINPLSISRIVVRLVYFWTVVGVFVLSVRVFLSAFSANPGSSFVQFITETSNSYMSPFRGIFAGRHFGDNGYLDVSALFAIIMYLLLAWGVASLVTYVDAKVKEATKSSRR